MARFKSEFLADYQARHGTPLAARVLGHVHELSRVGSRLAPLSNWASARCRVRWLNERLLGLDRRRAAAAVEPAHVRASASPGGPQSGATGTRAILFHDTFTNYYNPQIGLAAADLLEAAGLDVGLAPQLCCGRPLISQGLLGEARERAGANTDAPAIRSSPAGQSLVFLEPSCLSAVREDAPVAAARRAAAPRRGASPTQRCCSRTASSSSARRSGCPDARDRPGHDPAARPLPPEVDGHAARRPARCCRAFRARPSSTSTPAAAAWPARSDTCASTSTCRGRSPSGSCCRRCEARRPGSVLVAAGISCRPRCRILRACRRFTRPNCCVPCCRRLVMSLAVLSVAALAIAIVVSCVTTLNVGVLAVALAWSVGVLHRRHAGEHGDGRLSRPVVPDARRRDAAVHAGAVQRHARPAGPLRRPLLPRQPRRHADHVLRAGRRAGVDRTGQHRHRGADGADGDGHRRRASAFRCS